MTAPYVPLQIFFGLERFGAGRAIVMQAPKIHLHPAAVLSQIAREPGLGDQQPVDRC